MSFTNISANLLSLGAIDFGIIVDGAIVMAEAILRRRESKANEVLTEADVRETAGQVARPIFFATTIIIATYLPLFAFQRIEAKLFYPMIYAVGYPQLGALAFALLVVPGLAYAAYRTPRRVLPNAVLERVEAESSLSPTAHGRPVRRRMTWSRECRRGSSNYLDSRLPSASRSSTACSTPCLSRIAP